MNLPTDQKWNRIAKVIAFSLVLMAVFLRLWVYFQGRDLIIDEANIARNIYEKGFADLINPLDYQQYAPPIFLWITKLNATLLGFEEWSLKLYPLICGLAACVVLYKLLQKLLPVTAIWYPLALFSFSALFIRYSSELKQYMPDVLITLLLIWLALKIDIKKARPLRFISIWLFVGIAVVFTSMPSVFILAGVGCYYGWECWANKEYKKILQVLSVSVIWLAAFGIYFFSVLKNQADSEYLQNFHHYYFLFATPTKADEWVHNFRVFSQLMYPFEGIDRLVFAGTIPTLWQAPIHYFNLLLLMIGSVSLFKSARSRSLLLLVPILTLLMAAVVDKFSLLPRVSLFIIPVIIMLVGIGYTRLFATKSMVVKGSLLLIGLYGVGCVIYQTAKDPFKYEELTQGVAYIKEKGIDRDFVGIHHAAVPAYKYYSEIHPEREKWVLKGAIPLQWYTNYDSLGLQIQQADTEGESVSFIYTNISEDELRKRDDGIKKHLLMLDSYVRPSVQVYVYTKEGSD